MTDESRPPEASQLAFDGSRELPHPEPTDPEPARPEPAHPEPRRLAEASRRSGWMAALWTLLALALIAGAALVGVQANRANLPARLVSGPAATSTPATTPTPSTDPIDLLKKNPIYALQVTAHCPTQRQPASTAAFRKQVKGLVNCQNKAWKAALASVGISFSPPAIKHYGAELDTPCGTLGTSFPASYCTADRTLYFSSAAATQGGYYRLAVAEFVIHEYSHHVQTLVGIFDHTDAFDASDAAISRRIELQAHCMAHYGLTHSGFGFTAADRADAEYQFSYAGDPTGHGSATAERYWGRRGLAATTIGACNTWRAKAKTVK